MNKAKLVEQIKKKQSFLCIGLDTDITKIPAMLRDSADAVFEFNKAIIDATAALAVAYKPNTAFYEAEGLSGWHNLERTITYIKQNYPEIIIIADAKRGDIGNTSANYARAFFEKLGADAITVAPYMGYDSISPFLTYKEKWTILLGLTSNKGSADFQYSRNQDGQKMYLQVIQKAATWADSKQLMFVVGATHPEELSEIRSIIPDYFLLVPGVGAQGGSLEKVAKAAMNSECGLLVNSSRGIIYASSGADFAEEAAKEAAILQQQMQQCLKEAGVI
jgi:orotidine-5'-phosphate decarboxylase